MDIKVKDLGKKKAGDGARQAEPGTRVRRKFSREVRRRQLIDATIESIAKHGFADTTLAHVSKAVGLSQGIVNLHFSNKENLLVETLRFLRDDYRRAWARALDTSRDNPRDKLAALIALDFHASVCDRGKLACWFAFYGEAKSRPTYAKICEERDEEYQEVIGQLCRELADEYEALHLDGDSIASGLCALSQGLWLDMLTIPKKMTRTQARKICFGFLAQFFPRHFSVSDAEAYS